jgi:hypothetical protein
MQLGRYVCQEEFFLRKNCLKYVYMAMAKQRMSKFL